MAGQGMPLTTSTVPMVATGDVKLRDSPPSGPFYRNGEPVGVIVKKGQTVIATDQKTIKTLFGKYLWLKVKVVDAKTGRAAEGWVYAGETDEPHFVKAKTAATVQ